MQRPFEPRPLEGKMRSWQSHLHHLRQETLETKQVLGNFFECGLIESGETNKWFQDLFFVLGVANFTGLKATSI